LDVATILAQGQGAMAIISPGMQGPLLEWLKKHIFPMDKVAVTDITQQTKYDFHMATSVNYRLHFE
jgi:hypothetical protein